MDQTTISPAEITTIQVAEESFRDNRLENLPLFFDWNPVYFQKYFERFVQSTYWNYPYKRIFFINAKIFGQNMKIEWLNLF